MLFGRFSVTGALIVLIAKACRCLELIKLCTSGSYFTLIDLKQFIEHCPAISQIETGPFVLKFVVNALDKSKQCQLLAGKLFVNHYPRLENVKELVQMPVLDLRSEGPPPLRRHCRRR